MHSLSKKSFGKKSLGKKSLVFLAAAGLVLTILSCEPPDQEPPTVEITEPSDGETVSGYVTIKGEAVDEDSVASITLFIDDSVIDTFTESPFTYEWNTLELPDSSAHTIYATSLDPAGNEGHSDTVTVHLDHGSERPAVPGAPIGPINGKTGETLAYRATTTDPNGDNIAFQFDWGDGSELVWSDFIASGETLSVDKVFQDEGTYNIRVKAKDVNGAYSEYSSPLSVQIRVPTTTGCIEVKSDSTGAEVWLDGENTGKVTNTILADIDGGQHTLSLRKEGFADWGTTVTVIADDTVLVEAALEVVGELAWSYPTGGAVNSSPAVAPDGSIYIGSADDKLYKFDSTGKKIAEFSTDLDVNSPPAVGSNGKVYFGSNDVYIRAVHPECVIYWTYKTEGLVSASPAIGSDGTIYVGSADDNLYALTPDGDFIWKYKTGGDIGSSAAISSDGTIYFGSDDGYLYALGSTPDSAHLKWRYSTGGLVRSSPAIGQDGTIYFGSQDNYVYALAADGSLKWRYKTSGKVSSSPAIGPDGTVYIGSDDNMLYAFDAASGSLKWTYQTGLWVRSTPAVGSDGIIYFGSLDGYLYALRQDGTMQWRYKTGNAVSSSPAIGSNGYVYVGSTDNSIYAITSGASGLASSSWPKLQHDNLNSGRMQ